MPSSGTEAPLEPVSPPSDLGSEFQADVTLDALASTGIAGVELPPHGYALGEEIGRGGYGRVLVAQQRRFDREVAIKTLLAQHRHGAQVRAFIAEALVTAQMQHPGVVPIYDLHEAGDDLHLVMKRVVGTSWHAMLHPQTDEEKKRAARTGLDDHLDVLLKIAETLAYAHDRGVLHQ